MKTTLTIALLATLGLGIAARRQRRGTNLCSRPAGTAAIRAVGTMAIAAIHGAMATGMAAITPATAVTIMATVIAGAAAAAPARLLVQLLAA